MQIKKELNRKKAISDNEPLMRLINEVGRQICSPIRSRTLAGFEETKTGIGRAIKLTYDTSILGFNEKQETCTLFADRDYHLKKILRKY